MNEVLRPLYDKVERVLKGENVGIINTGVSDAFNQVSKEFIGYNCFGEVIFQALLNNLEDKIQRFREGGLVKSNEMFVSSGDQNNNADVAYELSLTLFPSVLELIHEKGDYTVHVVDAMWAFVPCDEYTINNVFDILGDCFKKEYKRWYTDNIPTNTEKLYENIVKMLPF